MTTSISADTRSSSQLPASLPPLHGSLRGREVTRLDRVKAFFEQAKIVEQIAKIACIFLIAVSVFYLTLGLSAAAGATVAIPPLVGVLKLSGIGLVAGSFAYTMVTFSNHLFSGMRIGFYELEDALDNREYYHAKCLLSRPLRVYSDSLSPKDRYNALLKRVIHNNDPIGTQLVIQQTGITVTSDLFKQALSQNSSLELIQVLVQAKGHLGIGTFWSSVADYAKQNLPQNAKDREKIIQYVEQNC